MHASFPPFTKKPEPTAAISDTESKLRTALAYVNHARSLLREALGDDLLAADSHVAPQLADFTRDRDATGA